MFFMMALRNVFRNKKRSFLTILTIFFAAMVVGLALGFGNGIMETYLRNFIDYQTAHIRITTQNYLERERFLPVDEVMAEAEKTENFVKILPGVKQVSERIRFGILLGKQETTVEALGMGLDLENNSFNIKQRLAAGTLTKSGIYLGRDLAKKINAQVGDELLLATKTSEGGLNGIKLKVNGIVAMGITIFDRKVFFISLADAKKLLKISQGTTELYILLTATELTDQVFNQIKSHLPAGIVAQTYKDQIGAFYDTLILGKGIYFFLSILIMFLGSFVVINTMMMAVFERMREIGTLKALGMTDQELFINFTLEGAILGAIGGSVGSLLGYVIVIFINYYGINFQAAVQNLDMPIEYIVRPELSWIYVLVAFVVSVLVPALSAMIPAQYARHLQPAEALRK